MYTCISTFGKVLGANKNPVSSILKFVRTNEIAVCINRMQLYNLAARLSIGDDNVPCVAPSLSIAFVIDELPATFGGLGKYSLYLSIDSLLGQTSLGALHGAEGSKLNNFALEHEIFQDPVL